MGFVRGESHHTPRGAMEITSTATKRVRADGAHKRRLATRLSMYTAPPGQDVSLDEFEELAYNRLQVSATLPPTDGRTRTHNTPPNTPLSPQLRCSRGSRVPTSAASS